jgi:nitroreductase
MGPWQLNDVEESDMSGKKKGSVLTAKPEFTYTEEVPRIDANEFQKVIDARRSVRLFDGTPVPAEVMEKALANALLAPNSSNLQPWEFYWVHSPEMKKEMVYACLKQVAARTAAELVVITARTKTWRAHAREMADMFKALKDDSLGAAIDYYDRLVPFVYTMGPMGILGPLKRILFFLRGLSAPIVREPVNRWQLRTWAVKSTALAAENLMLTFMAHGFDTCPMEGYDSKRIKRILGLPRDAVVVMVVAVGRRAPGGVYGPRIRYDAKRFVKKV